MSHIPLHALWVQIAAFVATLVGLTVTVTWNVRIARRRATLDILLQEQSVESLIRERSQFVALLNAGNLESYASAPPSEPEDAERFIKNVAVIRASMNRYELIALGIHQNAVDEGIYRGWCRTTLVGDWIVCKPLVDSLRTRQGITTYAVEFQWLARRWANAVERPQC